ncbi:MAG: hypothetical protein ACP5JR_03555 [Thermoplasmata archaeon]
MGYSVAVASAILFTSLLLSFSFIYAGVNFSLDAVQEGFNQSIEIRESKFHTSLTAVFWNLSMPETEIQLLNNGSVELNTNTIDILVDGVLQKENTTLLVNGQISAVCYPGEILTIKITNLTAVPEKVKIVAGNGAYTVI